MVPARVTFSRATFASSRDWLKADLPGQRLAHTLAPCGQLDFPRRSFSLSRTNSFPLRLHVLGIWMMALQWTLPLDVLERRDGIQTSRASPSLPAKPYSCCTHAHALCPGIRCNRKLPTLACATSQSAGMRSTSSRASADSSCQDAPCN